MRHRTPGQEFEADVIGVLRCVFGCEVFTSETLDVMQKVDGEIHRVGSEQLTMPVQLQITRRIDHFGKLDAYLGSRWLNTDIVSLYVEAHAGPSPNEVAEHIAWAALEVQQLPPFGPLPIYGLRIDDDASFFDPAERLRELSGERKSPERLAALIAGTVYRFEENGFWVMDEANLTAFFAHYIDAFDSRLRRRLRDRELQIPVAFLPVGPNRATDVRFVQPKRRAASRR